MHPEDVFLWPDGTWCYREELDQYRHKSDDYTVYLEGSHAWNQFMADPEIDIE